MALGAVSGDEKALAGAVILVWAAEMPLVMFQVVSVAWVEGWLHELASRPTPAAWMVWSERASYFASVVLLMFGGANLTAIALMVLLCLAIRLDAQVSALRMQGKKEEATQ
jgi:hypothetical protein